MVAEQYSGLDLAMLRLRKQESQLVSAAVHLHDPDRLSGPCVGAMVLGRR